MKRFAALVGIVYLVAANYTSAIELPPVVTTVEGQPLAAAVERLAAALRLLGFPLADSSAASLAAATTERSAEQIQAVLDPFVLLVVTINPESRVAVKRGPAPPRLQQA